MSREIVTDEDLLNLWLELEVARNTRDYKTAKRLDTEYSEACEVYYEQHTEKDNVE
jgi:hypothetical protein